MCCKTIIIDILNYQQKYSRDNNYMYFFSEHVLEGNEIKIMTNINVIEFNQGTYKQFAMSEYNDQTNKHF